MKVTVVASFSDAYFSLVRALPELTLETSKAPKLAYAIPIFAGTMVAIWLK